MKTSFKILSLPQLKIRVARLRRQGKKIAFTNGCFDILHYGHVSYLEQAKKNDRVLIIGVNSDASVRRIKGPRRPIIGEKYRTALLAGLACVDFVTIFREDTPMNLIKALKPDILIKGADWKGKQVVGSDVAGKVEYVHYLKDFSTTKIIETILKQCKK